MSRVKKIMLSTGSTAVTVLVAIGLILLALVLSFLIFTLGYWLITLVLVSFFGFILPFSWWYSLGAWLIVIIAGAFMLPGMYVVRNNNN